MSELRIQTPRWARPLIEWDKYRYIGIHGGRGSGKSWQVAERLILDHIQNPNAATVCAREFQRTLEESVLRLLLNTIDRLDVANHFNPNGNLHSVYGSGYFLFEGLSNHTSHSIKSLEGMDSAWIEEGQTLSVNSLTTLKPTIRKKGSKVIATWNPRYADDAIDDFFRGSTIPEKSLVIPVNYYDNPWLTDELRSDMLYDRAKDISLYEHVWLGGYENSSDSRVFKNWTIREFEAPNEVVHRLGADFGFAVDPTTLVRCHLIGDKQLYVDYEAYGEQTEIDELPDLFAEVPESSKWPMAADSSRPETISYLRNHGFPHVHGTVKGPGSAMEGVKFLQSFDIIVHPRCERMIIALQRYKFKTDSRTNKVLPILLHEKSDMIDALRYAAESVRRATGQNQNPDGRPPQGRRWR